MTEGLQLFDWVSLYSKGGVAMRTTSRRPGNSIGEVGRCIVVPSSRLHRMLQCWSAMHHLLFVGVLLARMIIQLYVLQEREREREGETEREREREREKYMCSYKPCFVHLKLAFIVMLLSFFVFLCKSMSSACLSTFGDVCVGEQARCWT